MRTLYSTVSFKIFPTKKYLIYCYSKSWEKSKIQNGNSVGFGVKGMFLELEPCLGPNTMQTKFKLVQ